MYLTVKSMRLVITVGFHAQSMLADRLIFILARPAKGESNGKRNPSRAIS
jgi:hypothetical protein